MSKIKGGKDGLVFRNNVSGKKSQPLITVSDIRQLYLFGVKIRDKETGEDLSDAGFQQALDTAISLMEHYLDLSVSPVKNFKEYKDYSLNDYMDFGYMQLNNYPVECINGIRLVYFRDEDGQPIEAQKIPLSWVRLEAHSGIIRLIPNNRFPSGLQIDANGGFFPEILRSKNVPDAWEIDYNYGFCDGQVPVLLNQAIGMLAAIFVLVTAGHLILGAGIAGTSISLDGLSQSISTTQSAENSGFSSVIKDYTGKLYGETKDDPRAILTILLNYYKGESMHVF